jgi:hypothetical protein
MKLKKITLLFVLFSFFAGCGGVNFNSIDNIPLPPDITIHSEGKSAKITISWLFEGNKNNELYRAVRSFNKVEAAIGEWTEGNIKEIKPVKSSFAPGKDDKELVSYFAQGTLPKSEKFSAETPIFIKFTAGEKVYKFISTVKDATPDKENQPTALTLIPYFEKTLRGLNIYTLVFRKFTVKDEYHPDGEKYRVRIYNQKGKMVWASDYNADFTQALEKVKPEEEGANYLYNQYWDGKDISGEKAEPGLYEFRITIPAFPIPYQTSVYYQWGK